MSDPRPTADKSGPNDAVTEELVAYLDGELDAKAAEAMATRLTLDPKLRAQAEALQRTWDVLDVLPQPMAPSASFASRTLSQAIPASVSFNNAATMPMPVQASSNTGFWLGSLVLILIAGVGGFVAHREVSPAPVVKSPDPELQDVPLMKNLRLYRNVDDLEYLQRLDTPEMFGEGE